MMLQHDQRLPCLDTHVAIIVNAYFWHKAELALTSIKQNGLALSLFDSWKLPFLAYYLV
jgi:hypothetical protein